MLGQVSEKRTDVNSYPEGISMQHVGNDDLKFRRHRRMRELPELTYEITEEPDLLHQYYVLRSMQISPLLPSPLSVEPDLYDKRANIMIIRSGRQVVGGIRIITRNNTDEPPLYIERGGFDLHKLLPHLELDKNPYCDLSRLFLLEEYRNSEVTRNMYRCIVDCFNRLGMRYGFAASSPAAARVHRRSLMGTGANHYLISNLEIPYGTKGREDNPANEVLNMFDTVSYTEQTRNSFIKKLHPISMIKSEELEPTM